MNAPSQPERNALATVHDAPRLLGGRDLILQADNLNAMIRVSELMANSGQAVPRHLRKNPGACFAVTSQAMRWNMDPYALAQQSYTTDDQSPLAYMGQAIIAALNNSPLLATRLQFEWGGPWEKIVGRFVWRESTKKTDDNGKPKKYLAKAWDDNEEQGLWCTVTSTLAGEREPRKLQLFLMQARVRNSPLWVEDPRQQLAYLAARRWGRLYAPDVIMGVYTPDELQDLPEKFMGDAEVVQPTAAPTPAQGAQGAQALPEMTAEDLGKREPKIAEFYSKGKTADEIAAFYGQKFTVPDAIKQRIRELKPAPADVQDVQPKVTYASVADRIAKATDIDQLQDAGTFIGEIADEQQRRELGALYETRHNEISAKD